MISIRIRENGQLLTGPCTCAAVDIANQEQASSTSLSPEAVRIPTKARNSYREILKSSALVGGSQAANIAIGIVRTKVMAQLLGPAGFGLFGLFGSIQNLTQSIAGMGINGSGVRQIAAAAGSGDRDRIARTAAVLRRTAIALGIFGALLLLMFSRQMSRVTFGNQEHTAAISLLSVAVLFSLVSGGQVAFIQGMRRIGDLAKMNIFGAFFGLCAAIPLVYFLRQKGVVPSIIVVAGTSIITSWWYSRKINIARAVVTFSEVRQETAQLLKLGSAFMASGLMTMGTAYAIRTIILRTIGLPATGLYQAAWTLGGLYVAFILQAMAADFYPRLTASIDDHQEANRLVNEQTLIGLLLAGPGVLATITIAPWVIRLIYSSGFDGAVGILRWICLGAMLQVITWPMGFIIVAKGKPALFFAAEFAWTVVALALSWFCVRRYGLNGAGGAFFGSYIFHWIMINPIVRTLTGFRWSTESCKIGFIFLSQIALAFGSFYVVPTLWAVTLGAFLTVASTVHSALALLALIPLERIPSTLRRPLCSMLTLLRHAPGVSIAQG